MSNEQTTNDANFFEQIRWPVIVVCLLGGHILLMMVGLVASASIPGAVSVPRDFEVDKYEGNSGPSAPKTEIESTTPAVAASSSVSTDRNVRRTEESESSSQPAK